MQYLTKNYLNNNYDTRSCMRCLYTQAHPLGLVIDDQGVCSGCRIHEEKDRLDWVEQWEKLKILIKPYKSHSGQNYDCIVPVSGASDSYFILDLVKNKLQLNPLIVTYNKYYNSPLGIRNLANLRIQFDCDILIQNVNPLSVKKITRSTLREFGSIYWHCIAGQTVFPVQTAVRYKIPLIIWGAHQGIEQVGMFSHLHEAQMTRRYRKEHDLMGIEADDLISTFDTIKEEDIWQYRYPDDAQLHDVGVFGIYLSNYVRWDPKAQHEKMITQYGYQTAKFSRTFDSYEHVDCFNYMNVHDLLKYYKHGFSKVTDHACREIRHGRLKRNQAEKLVQYYQDQPIAHLNLLAAWLNITEISLNYLLNQHRNPKFWEEYEPGQWRRKNQMLMNLEEGWSEYQDINFEINAHLAGHMEPAYITVGKGYP